MSAIVTDSTTDSHQPLSVSHMLLSLSLECS